MSGGMELSIERDQAGQPDLWITATTDLIGTCVTDMSALVGCSSLRTLDLSGTQWRTCRC